MDLWAVCHALNSKNRPKKKYNYEDKKSLFSNIFT